MGALFRRNLPGVIVVFIRAGGEGGPVNVRIVASLDRKRLGQEISELKRALNCRGIFDKETRRRPLAFAADAGELWDLNSVFLDNGTLNVCVFGRCARSTTAMAANLKA